MELRVPSVKDEFNFESISNSVSDSPLTPRGFNNFFFSAPSSPTHFTWDSQTQPILPFSYNRKPDQDFDFGTQFDDYAPLIAKQLFNSGKIKRAKQNPEAKSEEFKKLKNVRNYSPAIQENQENQEDSSSSLRSLHLFSSWSRRWKIKDLLLFRSDSEGREGSGKTHLLKKSEIKNAKNSIYRSTAVVNSVHVAKKRMEKKMSAHELHYRMNREISEEMRRKTFLPYKRSVFILSC